MADVYPITVGRGLRNRDLYGGGLSGALKGASAPEGEVQVRRIVQQFGADLAALDEQLNGADVPSALMALGQTKIKLHEAGFDPRAVERVIGPRFEQVQRRASAMAGDAEGRDLIMGAMRWRPTDISTLATGGAALSGLNRNAKLNEYTGERVNTERSRQGELFSRSRANDALAALRAGQLRTEDELRDPRKQNLLQPSRAGESAGSVTNRGAGQDPNFISLRDLLASRDRLIASLSMDLTGANAARIQPQLDQLERMIAERTGYPGPGPGPGNDAGGAPMSRMLPNQAAELETLLQGQGQEQTANPEQGPAREPRRNRPMLPEPDAEGNLSASMLLQIYMQAGIPRDQAERLVWALIQQQEQQ